LEANTDKCQQNTYLKMCVYHVKSAGQSKSHKIYKISIAFNMAKF